MLRRWPDFNPRFKGRPLLTERVEGSGISYDLRLEWRLAAKWALYRYEDFEKLDIERQAEHIAAYRIGVMEAAVSAREQVRQSKQVNRPRPGHRKGK